MAATLEERHPEDVTEIEPAPDFHDDKPDDKAEKGSWSDWRNNQQREYFPGVG